MIRKYAAQVLSPVNGSKDAVIWSIDNPNPKTMCFIMERAVAKSFARKKIHVNATPKIVMRTCYTCFHARSSSLFAVEIIIQNP